MGFRTLWFGIYEQSHTERSQWEEHKRETALHQGQRAAHQQFEGILPAAKHPQIFIQHHEQGKGLQDGCKAGLLIQKRLCQTALLDAAQ